MLDSSNFASPWWLRWCDWSERPRRCTNFEIQIAVTSRDLCSFLLQNFVKTPLNWPCFYSSITIYTTLPLSCICPFKQGTMASPVHSALALPVPPTSEVVSADQPNRSSSPFLSQRVISSLKIAAHVKAITTSNLASKTTGGTLRFKNLESVEIADCNIKNATIHKCLLTNCTIDNSTVFDSALVSCKVVGQIVKGPDGKQVPSESRLTNSYIELGMVKSSKVFGSKVSKAVFSTCIVETSIIAVTTVAGSSFQTCELEHCDLKDTLILGCKLDAKTQHLGCVLKGFPLSLHR